MFSLLGLSCCKIKPDRGYTPVFLVTNGEPPADRVAWNLGCSAGGGLILQSAQARRVPLLCLNGGSHSLSEYSDGLGTAPHPCRSAREFWFCGEYDPATLRVSLLSSEPSAPAGLGGFKLFTMNDWGTTFPKTPPLGGTSIIGRFAALVHYGRLSLWG